MNKIVAIVIFVVIILILIKFLWKVAVVVFLVGAAYFIYKNYISKKDDNDKIIKL